MRPDPDVLAITQEAAPLDADNPADAARLEALRADLLVRLRSNLTVAFREMQLPYEPLVGFALLQVALKCLRDHGWSHDQLLKEVVEAFWQLEMTEGRVAGRA